MIVLGIKHPSLFSLTQYVIIKHFSIPNINRMIQVPLAPQDPHTFLDSCVYHWPIVENHQWVPGPYEHWLKNSCDGT